MKNNKVISKVISGTLLCSMVGYALPVFAYTKDETVYSKLDSEGNNYKTIVSTHIENKENTDVINDLSDLINIKNTSGDETYTQNGNKFVWNANKNDIYYQGESSKELPIECNVKYELDGQEISANDIAGKSGKVKVTLQYTNKEERTVDINGKKVKMYVPFVVIAGTVIENQNARNIEVSSGKVVDDGTKTVVVGMAMPGLQESLGLSDDEVEVPSNVEITMDATNFETSSIISYVTPKVLKEDDLKVFDNLDEIYGQVNTLQSSMNKIQDGANTLKDGTTELATGANTLKNGTTELANGANTLKEGVTSAYNGAQTISSEVAKSTQSLKNDKTEALDSATLEAIKKQAAASSQLTEEQKAQIRIQAQTSSVLTEEQKAQIKQTAANRAKLTDEQITQITTLAKQKAVLTKEQEAEITKQAQAGAKLTDAQKAEIIKNAQANYPITLTDAEKALLIATAQSTATQTAINTALATAKTTAEQTAVATAVAVAQKVATETAETTAVETAQQIATQTAITTALTTAQSTATTTAMQTSTTVAKQVGNQAKKTFTNQVVSQMNTLGNGLNQLTSGLSQLNEGANTLANGTNQVNDGASTLADGTNQVNDGATTLAEGIKTFNEEGIKKICNYINGDVKDLTTRVQKLTDLSKEYNNFTMLDGENDGEVKFIMIADAVKKQEDSEQNKEEAVLSTNVINEENK